MHLGHAWRIGGNIEHLIEMVFFFLALCLIEAFCTCVTFRSSPGIMIVGCFLNWHGTQKGKQGTIERKKRDSPFPRSRAEEYRTVTRERIGASFRLGYVLGFLDQLGRVARHLFWGQQHYGLGLDFVWLFFFFSSYDGNGGMGCFRRFC